MEAPGRPDDFVRLQADDVTVYVSNEVWSSLKPGQAKLLVGISGYGRFWVHFA